MNLIALSVHVVCRDFLQILKVPRQGQPDEDMFIQHDAQWLAILRKTHSLLSCAERNVMMPSVYDEVTSAVQQLNLKLKFDFLIKIRISRIFTIECTGLMVE